jgi:hypothetical protein
VKSSEIGRRAPHNPKVGGSNPPPATIESAGRPSPPGGPSCARKSIPTQIPTNRYYGCVRGTKRKRSEGVWELRVYLGRDPEMGNPRQISRSFRGSSRDADAPLRDLVDKYGEGRPDGFGATFGQLLDKWLEDCERMELAPTTIRTHKAQIKQTIRPQLGKTMLNRCW